MLLNSAMHFWSYYFNFLGIIPFALVQICVWCWHHIMDMAEKDGTEGRCPACRTPYNKEKIVETSAKFERLLLMTVVFDLMTSEGSCSSVAIMSFVFL